VRGQEGRETAVDGGLQCSDSFGSGGDGTRCCFGRREEAAPVALDFSQRRRAEGVTLHGCGGGGVKLVGDGGFSA
jgi:hypothetical protein